MAYQINIANREINPRVINFFTFENQVTTLEFTLDSYMYDEVDLRNYKAYAVTSIKGSVDLTELEMTYDEASDKLNLKWNVGDYTLTQSGAIVYQITFKQNEDDGENSAVWYSYKAVMINRGTVDADHKIVAQYPTIMKQWLDKMDSLFVELIKVKNNAIEELEDVREETVEDINELVDDFNSSIVYIPYGETMPDRIEGRLYYQFTNPEHTNGQFEDHEGKVLSEINNKITNCITEIPQNIKYTLVNNRLTILTGSVIIVPYGTEDLTDQYPVGATFIHNNFKVHDTQFVDGKFFVRVEVLADLKNTYSAETNLCHVFANINIGAGLTAGDVASNTSGDTDTGTSAYRFWYDTANNLVKKFEGDANPISDIFALPLMVAQSEVSVGWKSIDQVFNGFGYIGSTIWVDKGVRGLIPNGRNADGTLKNIEHISNKINVYTLTSGFSNRNNQLVVWDDNTNAVSTIGMTYEVSKNSVYPEANYAVVFDETLNRFLYNSNTGIYVEKNWLGVGFVSTDSNSNIISFNLKLPFRAVDWNDFNQLNQKVENKFQVVSALPSSPDENVFYYITE